MTPIAFELNGRAIQVADCASHTTLLEFVRSQGLTGSKEGCAEGECGACTVLLVRPNGETSRFVPVNSCLVPLPAVAGQEVYTVESLASEGKLAEVQQAMVSLGGSQCGYCTPGFIVSMFAEQYRPDRVGPCDPHSLAGNLCRCTGYRPIRDALASVGDAPKDKFSARLKRGAPKLNAFASPTFSRPASVRECLEILREDPNARLIAGGTDLVVEMNLRNRRFDHLLSVEALEELRQFDDSNDEIILGAALTLGEIQILWQDAPPVIREWFPLFASPLIRNRATLGGNLATASPIGDSAPLLLALDAGVKIAGLTGNRTVALSNFFEGYRKTSLAPGELLVSIHIPKPFPRLARFFKIAKRRMDDISTVAAAFAIDLDPSGRIRTARLAFGGVAATPIRATPAEQVLEGHRFTRHSIDQAKQAIAATLNPIGDHRGSAEYRLAMAQSLFDKCFFQIEESAA